MKRKVLDIQRRVVAHKTMQSWREIPHVGLVWNLDMTALQPFIASLRDHPDFAGTRVTLNTVLLKLIAEGVRQAPDMNSELRYSNHSGSGHLLYHDEINIAIPMRAAGNRMITPVLRCAGSRSLAELCRDMETLKRRALNTDVDLLLLEAGLRDTWERLGRGRFLQVLNRLWATFLGPDRIERSSPEARARYRATPVTERLSADDLFGGTLLVSNYGSVLKGEDTVVVLLDIIPPHCVAIGLGGARKQPVVVARDDGTESIVPRLMVPMTVCFDHRVMDLEHILPFLQAMTRLCETPEALLERIS